MKKVGVREAQELGRTSKGFEGHVATDGSLLGRAGKWGACGWAVVLLGYDEEMGQSHGMYGSTEADLEVQRTITRAENASTGKNCTAWPQEKKRWKWSMSRHTARTTASSGEENDWRNREHAVFDLFLILKRVRFKGFFHEPLWGKWELCVGFSW